MILKCVSQIQYPTLTSSSIHRVFMSVLDLNCKWGNIHGVVRKRPPPDTQIEFQTTEVYSDLQHHSDPPPLLRKNKLWETLPWLIVINNKRGKNSVQLCVCLWPDSGRCTWHNWELWIVWLCWVYWGCVWLVSALVWSHPIIPSIWCPSTNS